MGQLIQEKCTVASNRANPLGNTQIIALVGSTVEKGGEY